MKTLRRVILLIPTLIVTALLAYIFVSDYDTLVAKASALMRTNTQKLIRELVPPDKIPFIEFLLILFLILNIILVFFGQKMLREFEVIDMIRKFSKRVKVALVEDRLYLVMAIPAILIVFLGATLPVSYDEAFTYLNFSIRGFFASVAYYPFPNNHILHSVFTNASLKIPFFSDLFLIRIPPIMFSTCSMVVVYLFFKDYLGRREAYLGTALCSAFFFSLYYGYMSRGYALLGLCFIAALYLSFRICQQEKKSYWFFFTMICVVGFYTIPTFLYPYITLNLLILISLKRISLKQIISGAATISLVLLLYSPIILVNGLSAIVGNRWTAPIARADVLSRLPGFLSEAMELTTGVTIILIILVVVAAGWVIISRRKTLLLFYFVMLVMPGLLLLAQSVIPFARTFAYYAVFLSLSTVIVMIYIVPRITIKQCLAVGIVLQVALAFNFYRKIDDYELFSMAASKDAAAMTDGKHFLIDESIFDSMLLFEFRQRRKTDFDFIWMNNVPINADTVRNFDYTIVHTLSDRTVTKKPISENRYYRIYR